VGRTDGDVITACFAGDELWLPGSDLLVEQGGVAAGREADDAEAIA